MDSLSALRAFGMGDLHSGVTSRVFDFDKALVIIKENNIKNAEAGLQSDMEYTAGTVLRDGELITDSYTFLGSTWAIPILVDLDTGDEYPCWCYNTDEMNPHGYNIHSKWEDRHFIEFNK